MAHAQDTGMSGHRSAHVLEAAPLAEDPRIGYKKYLGHLLRTDPVEYMRETNYGHIKPDFYQTLY